MLVILAAQMAFGAWIVPASTAEETGGLGRTCYSLIFLSIMLPLTIAFVCVYRMVRDSRPASPIRALAAGIRAYAIDARRLANGMPVIAVMVPFMMMYVSIKSSIPAVAPFSWDATLTQWDRALFMGWLPYEWLQPIVGFPPVTFALDVAYKFWFIVMWMSLVAAAFARAPSALRTRYITSFFLTWFLQGSLLAIALSSAGPCYYGLLQEGPDPYAPLLAYLREAHLWLPVSALESQAHLWSGHLGESQPLGISAAPSLHNATSFLMALAAWKVDRRLGLVFAGFAAVVFVGSIALAWHYALDGLIAFPVTLAIWFACGRFADLWERRAVSARPAGSLRQAVGAL